jgi:hypothetical protein
MSPALPVEQAAEKLLSATVLYQGMTSVVPYDVENTTGL